MALRVAMVCPRFAPLTGGTETHVAEVSKRLYRWGIEVTVLTTLVPGSPSVEDRGGVRICRFRRLDTVGDLHIAPGIARAIERGPFDIVHVQGVHTAVPMIAMRAARRRGLPTVLTFHTGGHSGRMHNAIRGVQWRALRSSLARVDCLVAVCEYEVELFSHRVGLPQSRFRLIRNGAERLPIDVAAPRLRGDPLILSVARLERYKGHHRLIAAMPSILASAPGAHLGIVGRGPYEEALRRMVAELGLERSVSFSFFGADERAQLGALMASADVVALLSEYEAHPVTVMEAVALGVPALVAEGSGMSELARDGLAVAAPSGATAEDLARLVLDCRHRSGGPAPGVLSDWDECTTQLIDVYRDVVSAG